MQTVLLLAARLDDEGLLRRLQELAGRERSATAELVAHLAELDARKLYLGEGYASLFVYCTEALHFAEHAAYKRIVAARACRAFPALLDHLDDGSLNLSTLRLVAPHLTAENFDAVIASAKGRSKREVEVLAARLAPQPEPVQSVRRLPVGGGAGTGPSPLSVPVSPGRYRIQFAVDEETHDTLRQVQDLLRREVPSGDLSILFGRALRLLLEETARTKLAAVRRPRTKGRAVDRSSRHLPAQIVRAVWKRDGGRCAFVGRNGNRCRERTFLEFHHVEAFGLGGQTTESNLSLRCRSHNQYEAKLVFGPPSTSPGAS